MQAPEVVTSGRTRGYGADEGRAQFFNNSSARISLIPGFMRRPMNRVAGFALVILSLMGAISLATWTISDPSLTFANGSQAENWLGFWGASFADFTMQFFGFAAIGLLVPLLVWGLFKVYSFKLNALVHRVGWWFASLVTISAALACISIPEGWPLQVGLGGVVGDAVLSIPRAFVGDYPSGIFAAVLFLLFAAPSAWLLLRACNLQAGMPKRNVSTSTATALVDGAENHSLMQEQELTDDFEDHAPPQKESRDWSAFFAMPLGLSIHLWYSLKTMLRNRSAAANQMTGSPVQVEPTMMESEILTRSDLGSIDPVADLHTENQFVSTPSGAEGQTSLYDDPAERIDIGEPPVFQRQSIGAPGASSDIAADDYTTAVPHTDAAEVPNPVNRVARRSKPKTANGEFILPELDLLSEKKSIVDDPSLSNDALEQNARVLEGVLADFGVKGQILKVRPGPVVTLYELEPAPGVKSSRVIGLAEDIARSMSAIAARVAVVPGRNAIGIELPNKRRETVYLREQLSSKEFRDTKAKLAMCLGKNIGGEPVIADLAKMPHLLMAGTTGSGKSVGINTMILSLLYRLGPDKCKMIMIDPKMLELSIYDGIPHLLTPVVVDPKKAVVALKWTVREMEERYKKMSKVGVRNIDGFNNRIAEAAAKGEVITRTVQTGFDRDTGEAIYEHEELDLEAMPFIVVIIDEMADLMMVAGKDIEGTVQRLAQMARAAGIHVIMATQRPSVDVITGTIKANFPTRISFQVTSKIDSRTILGEMGAEQLLGMGDMLYMAGGGRITRVHGPFVDDQEVEDVVNHLKAQGVPQYLEAVTEEDEEEADEVGGGSNSGGGNVSDSADPYDQAVAIVLRDRKASTSYIQRRLSVGYNKAASLIERMEQEGLISPANHAGKREILVPAEDETI